MSFPRISAASSYFDSFAKVVAFARQVRESFLSRPIKLSGEEETTSGVFLICSSGTGISWCLDFNSYSEERFSVPVSWVKVDPLTPQPVGFNSKREEEGSPLGPSDSAEPVE